MDSKFEKKPFTLTLLGTLTEYTPLLKHLAKPSPYLKGTKVTDYPKGETLSVVSSLIKRTAVTAGTLTSTNPYPLQSDEVTVVNGPKTDGSDVGEKIGHGLAEVLKAIARGQKRITVISHSRGVIEAIIIAHELEAIQAISITCPSLEELLKELLAQQTQRHKGTPRNNTPDILTPLRTQITSIPAEEQERWFSSLKSNLAEVAITLFGIDPVPGDCFPITWYDERFFILPEIIKIAELIYFENERSDWGLTPICPELVAKEKQTLVRYSMPGHHGTGSSGNNASQQGIIVSAEGLKTTHVQKLMVAKLLQFLNKQGVEFNDGIQLYQPHASLGRKYLGVASEVESIDLATLDYPTIFRTIYAEIAKNRAAYEAYNSTNYSYLGLVKQRKVLHKKHTYGLLTDIFPPYVGYVNEDHLSLVQAYFFKKFGLDTTTEPIEMLKTALTVLNEYIEKIASKDTSLLDAEMTRINVLETFNIVMQRFCQHYLTNERRLETQQASLHLVLAELLARFNELASSEDVVIKQFVINLLSLSYSNISNVLSLHYENLERECNGLLVSTDTRLSQFFCALLTQLHHSDPISVLNELVSDAEYKALPNYPANSKLAYIYKKLTVAGMEDYSVQSLIENYEDQYAESIENFATLYQQLLMLSTNLGDLSNLVPLKQITMLDESLLRLTNELIATAAERFYKETVPVTRSTENTFKRLAEEYACTHWGSVDKAVATDSVFLKPMTFFGSPIPQLMHGAPAQADEANKSSSLCI